MRGEDRFELAGRRGTVNKTQPHQLLGARLRVPEHVVHRVVDDETVVLDLRNGKYFALNHTGGEMIEILEHEPTVEGAAAHLARRYGLEPAIVKADMVTFCAHLLAHELLEVVGEEPGRVETR